MRPGDSQGGGFSAAPLEPVSSQCSCRDKNIAPGGTSAEMFMEWMITRTGFYTELFCPHPSRACGGRASHLPRRGRLWNADCHTSDVGHWFAMTSVIRKFSVKSFSTSSGSPSHLPLSGEGSMLVSLIHKKRRTANAVRLKDLGAWPIRPCRRNPERGRSCERPCP